MVADGIPRAAVEGMKDMIDCNIYFFDSSVSEWAMYLILGVSVAVLLVAYILMNKFKRGTK